jgi:hypothetical protein
MQKSKILAKLLQDQDNEFELVDLLDRMLADKLEDNQENPFKPGETEKKNYVGIEVECFSNLNDIEVMELLIENDLENHINIGDDGSIDESYGNSFELRILSLERELPAVLKRLGAFFKAGKFGTNDTCGLHVHLDMRNRNVEKCYQKLLKFQHLMFPLVDKERWTNEYCIWSIETDKFSRDAVNYCAYVEHRTIEIRLHQGTTDVKRIQNWVNLLLRAIKSPPIKDIKSKVAAVKWAGKNKALKSYINKEFKVSWFREKEDVMDHYREEDNGDF